MWENITKYVVENYKVLIQIFIRGITQEYKKKSQINVLKSNKKKSIKENKLKERRLSVHGCVNDGKSII